MLKKLIFEKNNYQKRNCQNLSTWVKKKPNPKIGHEFAIF